MSEDTRSTQFRQFAELLFEELKPDITLLIVELGRKKQEDIAHAEAIIEQHLAERMYDFAQHVIGSLSSYDYEISDDKADLIWLVPDTGEWPLRKEK